MSTFTENYNLIKPSAEDYYDVTDFNENFDAIDAMMAEAETAAETINRKIGEAEDTASNTVFGKLNQVANNTKEGFTAIKSIQNVKVSGSFSGDKPIRTVNPANCIVLFTRTYDYGSESSASVNYTLKESAITLNISSSVSVDFWIIEFC